MRFLNLSKSPLIYLTLILLIFSINSFAQSELKEGIQYVNLDGYNFEVKIQGKKHLESDVPVVVF